MEVYWPYPAGTGPGDDFTIIHYAGLDREFDLEDLGSLVLGTDYDLEVFTTARPLPADGAHVTYHALTAAEQGLRFAAGSFSPYVLVWEEPEGGAVLPGGDDDDDDESGSREEAPAPSGLNTGDHLAYLMGRGDGGLQPQAPITRGEVAAILFRLLSDEALAAHWSTETVYPDLPEGT